MSAGFRIATFNVESLDDRPQPGPDFTDRLAILRPQLTRLRADILCLQEVNSREDSRRGPRHLSALDQLLDGTSYEDFFRFASVNRQGKRFSDRHNLVILSRWPIARSRQVWHDLVEAPRHKTVADGADFAVEWDRPLLHAELDLGWPRPLHVINLHLRAPRAAFLPGLKDQGVWRSVGGWAEGFFLATIKRTGQALEARLLVDTIFDQDPGALIAVCGDFNAGDGETPVRTVRGDEEDTGNGHLAIRTLIPADRSVTSAQRFSVIHHGRPLMLDHILLSRALLGWYAACEIHNETLGDELVSPALVRTAPDSYHAPVVATFEPPSGPTRTLGIQASG
ncbi:endonuclease/exonuclease/phosphatase family protein [Telmatospirillum sp.]|uniref:endonuclease/exonuclease/phosphatase family protein n=1 Tax=Telmatospirillum sp. TaxID=2079197 RepID=UPI00284289D8|nr:endonuclease/exonuclease/phosphatase family protein [Telmatospirillum sp.]MDR3437185.1 endonuclease/exonuclease/phosphatase family protein [Telmatospirillum sp.]